MRKAVIASTQRLGRDDCTEELLMDDSSLNGPTPVATRSPAARVDDHALLLQELCHTVRVQWSRRQVDQDQPYPFTAPASNPSTSQRCTKANRTTTGRM